MYVVNGVPRRAKLSRPVLLIIITVLLLFIAVFLIYLFVLRPSDTDVKSAIADISIMENTLNNSVPSELNNMTTPGSMTPEDSSNFLNSVDKYINAVDSFKKSPAVQRSLFVSSTYNTYSSTLDDFKRSLTPLATSIRAYGNIRVACDKMVGAIKTVKSKSGFDTVATDCKKALLNAQSSSSDAFNSQFLSNYLTASNTLITAIDQFFSASDSHIGNTINTAQKNLNTASAGMRKVSSTTKVNYGFTQPSQEVFTKLSSALNSETTSLIR